MAGRRPRFEGNRGKPESAYGHMRQSNWAGSFQTINGGMRRLCQSDGWSRGYKDTNQSMVIDRPVLDKSYR